MKNSTIGRASKVCIHLLKLDHGAKGYFSPHFYPHNSPWKLLLNNIARQYSAWWAKKPRKNQLVELRALKNSKRGRKALLLGNGPSLNRLNVSEANSGNYEIWTVNEYSHLEVSHEVNPDYHVLSDPESFNEAFSSHTFRYLSQHNATLFIPFTFESKPFGNPIHAISFNDNEKIVGKKSICPLKPRSYSAVTLYKALALVHFLNYDEIYILGLDNTEFNGYRGTIDNKIVRVGMYAAGSTVTNESPIEVFTSGIAGRMTSYARLFGDLSMFDRKKIVNLNSESLVDVFTKVREHPLIK